MLKTEPINLLLSSLFDVSDMPTYEAKWKGAVIAISGHIKVNTGLFCHYSYK
jgi:hypothetical protein